MIGTCTVLREADGSLFVLRADELIEIAREMLERSNDHSTLRDGVFTINAINGPVMYRVQDDNARTVPARRIGEWP